MNSIGKIVIGAAITTTVSVVVYLNRKAIAHAGSAFSEMIKSKLKKRAKHTSQLA